MDATSQPVMSFFEKRKLLSIDTDKELSGMIDITILNSRTETVIRMKLISGTHCIDLSSLPEQEYSVRLVAGDNVWLQKIAINH